MLRPLVWGTLGVKTRKPRAKIPRTKKGKDVVSDLAKSGVKALAPMLIDAASRLIKRSKK